MLLFMGYYLSDSVSNSISKAVKSDISIASSHRFVLIPFD